MTSRRIQLAGAVYGVLSIVAFAWAGLRGSFDLYHHPAPWLSLPFPAGTIASLVAGVAIALAVIKGTRVLVKRTRWARALHVEFRHLLGPLDQRTILFFALTSGVAEELFFRGAMQPTAGLVISSLIFGAVHIGPGKRFLPWTLWATVMGFVFGALYAATGELLGPVVAHVLINYENMSYIDAYDPTPPPEGREPPAPRHPSDPGLVSSRFRTGRAD